MKVNGATGRVEAGARKVGKGRIAEDTTAMETFALAVEWAERAEPCDAPGQSHRTDAQRRGVGQPRTPTTRQPLARTRRIPSSAVDQDPRSPSGAVGRQTFSLEAARVRGRRHGGTRVAALLRRAMRLAFPPLMLPVPAPGGGARVSAAPRRPGAAVSSRDRGTDRPLPATVCRARGRARHVPAPHADH